MGNKETRGHRMHRERTEPGPEFLPTLDICMYIFLETLLNCACCILLHGVKRLLSRLSSLTVCSFVSTVLYVKAELLDFKNAQFRMAQSSAQKPANLYILSSHV